MNAGEGIASNWTLHYGPNPAAEPPVPFIHVSDVVDDHMYLVLADKCIAAKSKAMKYVRRQRREFHITCEQCAKAMVSSFACLSPPAAVRCPT